MLLMKRARKNEVESPSRDAATPPPDLQAAIRSIGKQASTIGRESAEVRGLLDDTTKASERGALAVAALTAQVTEINRAQAGIGSVSTAGLGAVDRVRVAVEAVGREVGDVVSTLREVAQAAEAFLDVSERLIELVAECGIETEDTPYIQGAVAAANQIAGLLEAAVASGTITAAHLFDESYQAMPRTNPPQHLTRFVALADKLFPPVQEQVLALSQRVVFCIAVDRNGYVATHNKKYDQPQRGDLAWDSANSRYRRIFADRTGLASARNERPFLLQTYRRDMGGGSFVVMKEAAAPITVNGRHWGGLRLAFKF